MRTKKYYILSIILICLNSCTKPTCYDGKQNQGETGIDCGGPCSECPPTVETLPAEGITLTSANLSMNYYKNSSTTINSVGVCYGTSHNPTINSSIGYSGFFDLNATDGDFNGLITNLSPSTTYYIRGYLKDENAIAYGIELSFTTKSPVLNLATITTTSATSVTQTTAISGGNISNDGGATISSRGICYGLTSNPDTSNTYIPGGSGNGSFSSSISGLTQSTTYYVRAYASNSVGTAYGNQISFTTSSYALPTLTTTTATSITQTTAISGGNVTSDGGATVTSKGICYNTTGNPTTSNSVVSSGSGTGSFISNLTGLNTGTTYYVRAFATNSVGTSYGNQISFTTNAAFTIGQSYGGGIIAYIDSSGLHGLIAAPTDQGTGIIWHSGGGTSTGAFGSAIGTGNNNTNSIIALYGSENNAARICYDLVLGGYSDWYLPSSGELFQLYFNRSIIGGFDNNASYWSSTEAYSVYTAWCRNFVTGYGTQDSKLNQYHVRAVRSF